MPEGHTIHRLAKAHTQSFAGSPVYVTSPQGRFVDGAAQLNGRVLRRVEPYGKHLLYRFEGISARLHVHLGLYGKFVTHRLPVPDPVGALRLRFEGMKEYADLRGPTACELMLPGEVTALLARLGPDPLKPRADAEQAWLRISRRQVAIGALLMDQAVLAGVGNVYRAEVLFRARMSPYRLGRDVSHEEFTALWTDLVLLMKAGVRDGRIITTLPEDRPAGQKRHPNREASHYVYRRTGEPCRICGTPIRTALMVARNLYWCPNCQAY
jgi:endonuclease-8